MFCIRACHMHPSESTHQRPVIIVCIHAWHVQVSKVQIPDYNTWVKEEKEMWVEKIANKVKANK